MGDHYQTLGLQRNASNVDIKNAYFRLAHRYHPDHHNLADAAARAEAARRFREAKDAYDVLSDYQRRAEYDWNLRRYSSSSSSSSGYRTSSSSSSSSSKQRNRQGGSSSSSSSSTKHGKQHTGGGGGFRSGPPPPRPRGGRSILQNVFLGSYVVVVALGTVGDLIREWKNMERDVETMKQEFLMRKRQWENMKREWEKKNPWKSWMESREKEKKKNRWTDIFRS